MLFVGISREVKLDHNFHSFIPFFFQFREIIHVELVVWRLVQQVQPNLHTWLLLLAPKTACQVPNLLHSLSTVKPLEMQDTVATCV